MADDKKGGVDENEDKLGGPLFDPPLYCQRYSRVAAILQQHDVKSVIDFGCAECKFMRHLRNLDNLREVAGVDVLKSVLLGNKYLITPLPMEYLRRRPHQLRFRLFEGSISDYDSRLQGFEAVTMIEVIEHLEADILEHFPAVLFGQFRPKLVVMTTPNEEFNILFPGFTGMRHWDHKFEWTRSQFQNWCTDVAERYGYSVEYDGIGDPPPDRQDVGHCSQMAMFVRSTDDKLNDVPPVDVGHLTPYVQVAESVYPEREKQTQEEELLSEAGYYIRLIACDIYSGRLAGEDWDDENKSVIHDGQPPTYTQLGWDGVDTNITQEDGRERDKEDNFYSSQVLVPLKKIMSFRKVHKLCSDPGILRILLENSGYEFLPSGQSIVVTMEESEPDMEDEKEEDWEDALVAEEGGLIGCGQFSDAESEEENGTKKPVIMRWNDGEVPNSQFPILKLDETVYPGQFDDAEEDVNISLQPLKISVDTTSRDDDSTD